MKSKETQKKKMISEVQMMFEILNIVQTNYEFIWMKKHEK